MDAVKGIAGKFLDLLLPVARLLVRGDNPRVNGPSDLLLPISQWLPG
jgi:hypothetical protein